MSIRILITGSRDHSGAGIAEAIFAAIRELGGDDRDVTIVHGGAAGADAAAAGTARLHEFATERHDANWRERGPAAGPERNQRMVDAGADICLAFPLPGSRGTWDCVRRAKAAGIPVRVHERLEATT